MDDLLNKAEEGDAEAAHRVYQYFKNGTHGFKTDSELAYHWLLKAYKGGCAKATASLGLAYLGDQSYTMSAHAPKNTAHGLVMVTDAAKSGSCFAAYKLGKSFALGMYGLPVDYLQAKKWLLKSLEEKDSLKATNHYRAQLLLENLSESNDDDNESSNEGLLSSM